MKNRHTRNNFKAHLKNLSVDEKKQLLNDIQITLIGEKTREKSHLARGVTEYKMFCPHNTRVLRRQIAVIKTDLNKK